MKTLAEKYCKVHTRSGCFHLVDDCMLIFTPKDGQSYKLTVSETHRLLNMLFDYRRTIVQTNKKLQTSGIDGRTTRDVLFSEERHNASGPHAATS